MPYLALARRIALLLPIEVAALALLVSQLARPWRNAATAGPPRCISHITRPDVGMGVSCDGLILSANATFAAWLGYTPGELAGLPVRRLTTGPAPTATDHHLPFTDRIIYAHKDGHLVPLKLSAYPVITEPGKVCWVTLFEEG